MPNSKVLGVEERVSQFKNPISVLIVVYTKDLEILLLERADREGFWQSVTGSQENNETLMQTAVRELLEETGISSSEGTLQDWNFSNEFEIFTHWRHRYAPGVTKNREHVFGIEVTRDVAVTISDREHTKYQWVDIDDAIPKVFSWTNAEALEFLHDNQEVLVQN